LQLKEQLKEAQAREQSQELDRLIKENEALRTQLAQHAVGAVKDSLVYKKLAVPTNANKPSTKHYPSLNRDDTDSDEDEIRSDQSTDGDSLPRDISVRHFRNKDFHLLLS